MPFVPLNKTSDVVKYAVQDSWEECNNLFVFRITYQNLSKNVLVSR